jgi:prolyl 4-hydroxylase
MLKLSTILGSLFYLLPVYIFVIAPVLRQIFPPPEPNLTFDPDDAAAGDLDLPLLNGSIFSLDDGVEVTCAPDNYRVHILRHDPLVIYIEDFLSSEEADHLAKMRYSTLPPLQGK